MSSQDAPTVRLYKTIILVRAIRASCSVPGVFSPTPIDDMLLVDGGIKNSVPGDVVKSMGARFSVAINLNSDRGRLSPPKNGFDVLWSSLKIAWNENTVRHLKDVDVIVEPDLKDFSYYDLKHIDALIKRGETAMRAKIEEVLAGVTNKSHPRISRKRETSIAA